MKNSLLFILAVGATLAPSAFANSTPLALTTLTAPPSGPALSDTGVISFTGLDSFGDTKFTGTLDSTVYQGASGLDFWYEVKDSTGDSIDRITMTNFTGYTVTTSYYTASPDAAPISANVETSGDTVGFDFNGINNGETVWLEIATNAVNYMPGSTALEDGGNTTVTTFAPSPEPMSMGLLGIGFAGLGLLRFKSRRKN